MITPLQHSQISNLPAPPGYVPPDLDVGSLSPAQVPSEACFSRSLWPAFLRAGPLGLKETQARQELGSKGWARGEWGGTLQQVWFGLFPEVFLVSTGKHVPRLSISQPGLCLFSGAVSRGRGPGR